MDHFPDQTKLLRVARNPRNSFFQWLGKAGTFRRFSLFAFFVVALALFLHMREERVDILEPNTKSARYVIAQKPFSFVDDDATQILRQQAGRDIGEIYKIDERQLLEKLENFNQFLAGNEEWRQTIPDTTFEQMIKGAEGLERILSKERFTDSRTLQKMRQLKMSLRHIEVISSKDSLSSLGFSEQFWVDMRDRSFRSDLSPEARAYIIQWFKGVPWMFQQDILMERALHEKVQGAVPQKYTRVEAGSPIIQPGEEVTSRHLAMLNAMKEAMTRAHHSWSLTTVAGSLLLSILFTLVSLGYFRIRMPDLLASMSKLTLLLTIILATLLLSKGVEYFLYHEAGQLAALVRYPLFIPFASLLVCILIGTEIALFTSFFLTIVLSLSLSSSFEYDHFIVANLLIALAAITLSRRMRKRSQTFSICMRLWLLSLLIILAFNLLEGILLDPGTLTDMMTTLVFLLGTAVLVIGLLPTLETCFGVLTDITLMQLLDPNQTLLRRLSLEAPGTYQHCLVAGNLAEVAARAIGANGLFCRVSTLYHDIGKLFNPHYFTENQLGGFNIHQLLTPRESAQVIMSHVSEGEVLARKYHLPPSFLDIIREHHGTTIVYYFYCKQVELAGGDPSQVDERQFRYKGPKPRSRESAIIMICDSIEATTRSLDEFTEEVITATVHRIVKEKIDDGQLDDCRLTFEELATVKRIIIKTLLVAHHMRIKYPAKPTSAS